MKVLSLFCITLLLTGIRGQSSSSRPNATLSSTFFDRQAEFPNYFLPEAYRNTPADKIPPAVVAQAKDKLTRAMSSIFRRTIIAIEENGKIVSKRYYGEIGKIASELDPAARIMPSGGVVRASLGYLYEEIHAAAGKGIPAEQTLEQIINAKNDISGLDVRGVGSDIDILIDSPAGKSGEMISRMERVLNSAREAQGIPTDVDLLQNTLFPKADVLDYQKQMSEAVVQGGSTLDFLAFDINKGVFVEPKEHTDIVENFVRGVFDYTAPKDASQVRNPAKQTIRGMRPLLEIPFLGIKDETVFRRELDGIIKGGTEVKGSALVQFDKMVRNSRFAGAHNRFLRSASGSLEEKIREVASHAGKKIPEFANSIPPESRVLSAKMRQLDESGMLVSVAEFIKNNTDGGVLYHGTSRPEDALSIARGGMFISGGVQNQGGSIYGTGVYTAQERGKAEDYARGGVVFEMKVKKDSPLRIIDMEQLEQNPQWRRVLESYGYSQNRKRAFDRFVADYGIDILLPGKAALISLIQNTDILEMPKNTTAVLKTFNSCLTSSSINIFSRLNCFSSYQSLYGNIPGHLKKELASPGQILSELRPEMKKFILDSGSSMSIRLDIFESYKDLAPPEDVLAVRGKLCEGMEKFILDSGRSMRIRLDIFESYKDLAPPEDVLAVRGKLREGMEKFILDSGSSMSIRLDSFESYKDLAPPEDVLAVRIKLREGMEKFILDSGSSMSIRLDSFESYKDLAPPEDVLAVRIKLREGMEKFILDSGSSMSIRLDSFESYKDLAPSEDVLAVRIKLREGMEKFVLDTRSDINDRFNVFYGYEELAPSEDVLIVKGKFLSAMEEVILDSRLDIKERLDIIKRYQNFAPREDITKFTRKLDKDMAEYMVEYIVKDMEEGMKEGMKGVFSRRPDHTETLKLYKNLFSRENFLTVRRKAYKKIILDSKKSTSQRVKALFVYDDLVSREDFLAILKRGGKKMQKEIREYSLRLARTFHVVTNGAKYLELYSDIYSLDIAKEIEHPGYIKRRFIARGALPDSLKDIPDPPIEKIPPAQLFDDFVKESKRYSGFCPDL